MDKSVGHTVSIEGRIFQIADLINASEHCQTFQIPLVELETYLHDDIWEHCNPATFLHSGDSNCCSDHQKRITEADVSYPLLFDVRHELLDGAHRILKGFQIGAQTLPGRIISQLPDAGGGVLEEPRSFSIDQLATTLSSIRETDLPPSLILDLIGFAAGHKALARTDFRGNDCVTEVAAVLNSEGFYTEIYDGSLYYGLDEQLVICSIEVDNAPVPHAFRLGGLLGYPACCSLKVAQIGEGSLDEYADAVSNFNPSAGIISPAGYADGCCLISHIPCSTTCSASLAAASSNIAVMRDERILPLLRKYWPGYSDRILSFD